MNNLTHTTFRDIPIQNSIKGQEMSQKTRIQNKMATIQNKIMFNAHNNGFEPFTTQSQEEYFMDTNKTQEGFTTRSETKSNVDATINELEIMATDIQKNIGNLQKKISANDAIHPNDIGLLTGIIEQHKLLSKRVKELDSIRRLQLSIRADGVMRIKNLLEKISSMNDSIIVLDKRFKLSLIRLSDSTQLQNTTYSNNLIIVIISGIIALNILLQLTN